MCAWKFNWGSTLLKFLGHSDPKKCSQRRPKNLGYKRAQTKYFVSKHLVRHDPKNLGQHDPNNLGRHDPSIWVATTQKIWVASTQTIWVATTHTI